MATGKLAYLQDPSVIVVDWIGFLCLFGCSLYLFYKLTSFKGPDHNESWYMGYREDKMLSVFVNLFAALAYWARICSHANGDVGPAAQVVAYKYLDYLLTCPLLTLDLMWSLNLPYKFTYAGFVFCCIISAFMCSTLDGNARYMWFGFGLSLFGFTWYSIITVVRMRLEQFIAPEAKKVRLYLKIACLTYFAIWCGYPTLWLVHEVKILSDVTSAILHTFLDVLAKSVYGLALLSFVLKGEKSTLIFVPFGKDEDDSLDGESVDENGNGRPPESMNRRQSLGTRIGGKSRSNSIAYSNEGRHSVLSQHRGGGMSAGPFFPPANGSFNPGYQSSFDGSFGPSGGLPRPAPFQSEIYSLGSKLPIVHAHNHNRDDDIPPFDVDHSRDPQASEDEVSRVQNQIRKVQEELAHIMSQNRPQGRQGI